MRWAAVFQKQLMDIAWPEVVLEWPMCSEVYDHENNVGGQEQLLWKGLRVRIGMACGKPQYRKPLNTGKLPPQNNKEDAKAVEMLTDSCILRAAAVFAARSLSCAPVTAQSVDMRDFLGQFT